MVGVMRHDSAVRGDRAAQCRKNLHGDGLAVLNRWMLDSTEQRAFLGLMLLDEFPHLVDGVDAVQVAVPLRHAPREQAVASEDQAFGTWVLFDGSFDEQRKFKTRSLPRNPDDFAIELLVKLIQLTFAIGTGGQGNRPVGMQMIDVRKRKERMQRSIDGRGNAILAKSGERIVADHLVLILLAAVQFLQVLQAIEIKKSESRLGNRANVAATAFDCQHAGRCSSKRVG